jgi:hypothetical protein
MSQFPHDEFAKNLFELLLTPFGGVEIERGVQPEAKAVDIYFQLSKPLPIEHNIGLIARCITQAAIFEPFRNPVGVSEIQMCIAKLFEIQQELVRDCKRLKQPDSPEFKPRLWILTPNISRSDASWIWGSKRSRMGAGSIFITHSLPDGDNCDSSIAPHA